MPGYGYLVAWALMSFAVGPALGWYFWGWR